MWTAGTYADDSLQAVCRPLFADGPARKSWAAAPVTFIARWGLIVVLVVLSPVLLVAGVCVFIAACARMGRAEVVESESHRPNRHFKHDNRPALRLRLLSAGRFSAASTRELLLFGSRTREHQYN
jgi:hypothetical protein